MNVNNIMARLVRWFTALVAVTGVSVALADERDVTAMFSLESEFLASVIDNDTIAGIERAVTEDLASQAKAQFPFLKWQAADADLIEGPQLILRMVDIAGGACDTPPSIDLQWLGVIADERRPLNGVPQTNLYQTCDPEIPIQEPNILTGDIVLAVQQMLGNEATQQKILEQLLAKVPFARQLINNNNAMLSLPVSGEELLADKESEMVAEFNFLTADADSLFSRITMSPHDVDGESVSVKLLEIDVPSQTSSLPQGGALWDDSMVEVLENSEDMKVYMRKYVASPFAGQSIEDTDVQPEL